MTNQNITNGTYTNDTSCSYFIEPQVSIYIRLAVTALVLLVALVGNLMVLRAVCRLHGRIPLIYQLVANLAAGELGQVILAPFLLYYEETWWPNGWPFGEFLCKVINPLHNVFLTNVTLSMATIAVYRCLMVYCSPKRRLNPFHTKCLLASFWCVGVAIALPTSVTRVLRPCPTNPAIKNCCRTYWNSSTYNIYNLVWSSVVQYIPISTMTVAYTLAAMKIRRHIVIIKKRSRAEKRESEATDFTKYQGQHQIELQHNPGNQATIQKESKPGDETIVEMENNLLKMMYIIVISFLICYLPYPILFVLYYYKVLECWKYGGIFGMYSIFVLSNLPSALHPLFYGTKSKFFAKAFSRILSCKWKDDAE